MNIYSFIPLLATIAYVPLLITAVTIRPWRKQHLLFLLFLSAAFIWSLTDFLVRTDILPLFGDIWLRIIVIMFVLMAVQFHAFTSSFFPPEKRRLLPFAYSSLVVISVLVGIGLFTEDIAVIDGVLHPEYKSYVGLIAIPLLVLLARNIYVLAPRLRNRDNPVVYNQTLSLIIGLSVLTVFTSTSLLPWGGELPLSHAGNMIIALILSYAVTGHHLVDVRFVLRRGFVWLCIGMIGIVCYWAMLIGIHYLLDIELTTGLLFASSMAAIITLVIVYKMRDLIIRIMGQAFQGECYYYRQQLVEFAGKIQNVFSLKQQGAEFLSLITQAVNCQKAGLLFMDANRDFTVHLVEPADGNNPVSCLKIRGDNPIIQHLQKQRRPVTKENLSVMPEFMGLWQQEKDAIENSEIELIVPLISRERIIGILVLDKKRSGYYNLEDYGLIESVTRKVSVSMEKEYLREQLKEREEELSVINRSNLIITSSLDIQRIYDTFIKELKRVVDVNWAAISVIENDQLLFMAISTEIGSPWQVGERIPLKGTATEWLREYQKPVIIADLSQEERFITSKYHLQRSIRSIVYLPLMISNQVIGTLTVASRNPNAYNARHLKLLEQLASQIAMPIENARLYAKTERLARVDSLTGLLNRRSLDELLPSEIGRHSRYGGVFSLIILDLDSLKALNDNYGHLAGDELLRQIGIIIKNTIREADQAFRYGGDEFAILLPHTDLDSALRVAERIRQKTFAQIEIGSIPISVSLGIACWPSDGVSPNDLLAAADAALYKAKRSGGNRSEYSSISLLPFGKPSINVSQTQDSEALSTIYALAATVDARDRLTHHHSKNVHDYAIAIGEKMGMNQLEINHLGTCALLHDIGKIGISDEILNKQDSLTAQEFEIMKMHPVLGAAIASHSSQLVPCIQGILHHHEWFNGTGYPDGLRDDEIPLEARILAIADTFAVMTSNRFYAQALDIDAAKEEIKKRSGTQFDPGLVKNFLAVLHDTMDPHEKVTIKNKTV
ncbi:MAG: diguanylate cyclase [Dehalococcoidales bacterium]|nr:diguanylate cyclase [Dehalococcoidales bacterium]